MYSLAQELLAIDTKGEGGRAGGYSLQDSVDGILTATCGQ